jgi:DNA polymerase
MNIITIDFESYYTTKGLGFRTQTTEEYIRDPDFEVIGASAQVNDGAPVWVSGSRETMRKWLATFDWRNSMLLAHNTLFDGAILNWVYGIKPAVYLDTLCIARAIHGVDAGGSLKALAERYQVGVKGEEVLNAIDKRRVDFTPEELARYGEYCCNDVMLTNRLFKEMSKDFPMNELRLIDMTLRMFIEPMLYVDQDKLSERLEAMHIEKSELLSSLKQSLKCETEEEVRKNLSSNAKFAKVLKDYGLTVPMKHSDKQKKDVPALAKKDEGFIALCESEDTYIQHLCAVRLGTKSTLEEGRIKRFMDIGRRNKGMIPVPLKYYGAHTGRWSGMDKINFQNLPSRDPKKKALKKAIVPPDGYVVINCDSSQIEARMVAWLAGQDDVVKQFADGEDVYSLFATAVYERTITKKDAEQRFVGKTCILGLGYGTGATKLQHTLATSQPISVKIDEDEAKRIVGVYRDKNDKIIDLWGEADRMLEDMMNGSFKNGPKVFGQHNCVYYDADGIILPNNLRIRYKNLRKEVDEDSGKVKTVYDSRRGTISIWGGAVVENVVQALARIVVGEQMIQINEHHRVALTVHDAAVLVVPEDEKDKATKCVTGLMSVAPAWAQGLPVACEAHSGPSYGDC